MLKAFIFILIENGQRDEANIFINLVEIKICSLSMMSSYHDIEIGILSRSEFYEGFCEEKKTQFC